MSPGSRSFALTLGLAAALAGTGCSADKLELSVDLKTDLAPGLEFWRVRTDVSGPTVRTIERVTRVGDDYVRGERVADASGLDAGEYLVFVALVDTDGTEIVTRRVRLTLASSQVITIVLARTCRGVRCPRPGDQPTATTCAGGECVDPACTDAHMCVSTACTIDADCSTTIACVDATCTDGICLEAPNDSRCPGGRCDPDEGCVAAPPDAGATPLDAGPRPDAGVDAGNVDGGTGGGDASVAASDGGPPCASDGTPCDNGVFCDGPDECTTGVCIGTIDPCPGMLCDEARNMCTACGMAGSRCCPGDLCDPGVTCAGDTCFARCGAMGEACCLAGDPCPGGACVSGTCGRCGELTRPCCAGGTCLAPLHCSTIDGRCESCGGPAGRRPCCSDLSCDPGYECDTSAIPVPLCFACGAKGERCCAGSTCSIGLMCFMGLCS